MHCHHHRQRWIGLTIKTRDNNFWRESLLLLSPARCLKRNNTNIMQATLTSNSRILIREFRILSLTSRLERRVSLSLRRKRRKSKLRSTLHNRDHLMRQLILMNSLLSLSSISTKLNSHKRVLKLLKSHSLKEVLARALLWELNVLFLHPNQPRKSWFWNKFYLSKTVL